MNIPKILLKIVGKENMVLDNRIGIGYILRLCWDYGWMMVRGKCFGMTVKGISKSAFIGKRVKLIGKKCLTIGPKTKIHDFTIINALSTTGVTIGANCVIGKNTTIACTSSISNLGVGLKIGDNSTFGNDCFFGAVGGIEIGSDVLAGQLIRFHSENHIFSNVNELIRKQGVTHKGIRVGNDCWIGAGVVFLDGAELGNGCVVAANAVVTKKFPDNSILGGVPAKVIGYRSTKDAK